MRFKLRGLISKKSEGAPLSTKAAASSPQFDAPPTEKQIHPLHRPVRPLMLVVIVLGVIILRGWIIEGVIVDGDSMYPTLKNGERLLVLKEHYRAQKLPARGNIVILEDPQTNTPVVKRVIALPDDLLTMLGTAVYINGERLNEPYARAAQNNCQRDKIPAGEVWVLGDNRDNSTDSRVYGPVRVEELRGRALLRLWPLPPAIIPQQPSEAK